MIGHDHGDRDDGAIVTAPAARRIGEGALVLSAGALVCATLIVPPGPGSPVLALVLVVVALGW